MKVTGNELRSIYLSFFEKKGHHIIPSSPVVPENDPTVLFTTAGMHPLVPYLLGEPHPSGTRLVDYQKCVRTDDIDEVGDTFHHTFFEMLGNWSLGDYFKKESIAWSHEFLSRELGLDLNRLYITCFAGDSDAPRDTESAAIWKSLGIPKDRIYFYPKKDNWWGPAGLTGPCGPDTEMHYDTTLEPCSSDCKPGCSCNRFCEIWNNVFMEYNKTPSGKFEKLSRPSVDTGMGLERTTAVLNGLDDNYRTDLWQPIISSIEAVSKKEYSRHPPPTRIVADHLRAAVFITADGVLPSNKERGYILRRLIRRAAVQLRYLGTNPPEAVPQIIDVIIESMAKYYPSLSAPAPRQIILGEIIKFQSTLEKGLREFHKQPQITGKVAFDLFQTYGFPWEITAELAHGKGQQIDRHQFLLEFQRHQDLSRRATRGMFKGGLQDHSEITTKYHTATHLLHAALRQILGTTVHQSGSNITSERLRFDYTHNTKLTSEQLAKIEKLTNEKIEANLPVHREEMSKEEALQGGALAFFPERYPERTSVYTIGNKQDYFSKELCGGPHVTSTGQIGRVRITREESLGNGIRRIYAQLVV